MIECPAGMFEENESDPLIVSKRELLEETGYGSDNWTYFWFYIGIDLEVYEQNAFVPCQRLC